MMKPRTQRQSEAPTEPTEPKMDDGVEKTPVPMTRPTLRARQHAKQKAAATAADVHEQRADRKSVV